MGNVHMEASQINYRGGETKMSVEEAIKAGSSYELPIASAATLGGVKIGTGITIAEGGAISADAQLPADPVADGTKVLTATTTIGETVLSWEEPATGGVNYSTSEQNTGLKWIDGKDIYVKTVEFGTLPNNTTETVSANITPDKVIKMEAFGVDSNSTLPIPRIATGSNGIDIYYTYSTNSIVITTFKDMSTHTAYVTLFYTKVTT